jgi:hypothetical protein
LRTSGLSSPVPVAVARHHTGLNYTHARHVYGQAVASILRPQRSARAQPNRPTRSSGGELKQNISKPPPVERNQSQCPPPSPRNDGTEAKVVSTRKEEATAGDDISGRRSDTAVVRGVARVPSKKPVTPRTACSIGRSNSCRRSSRSTLFAVAPAGLRLVSSLHYGLSA